MKTICIIAAFFFAWASAEAQTDENIIWSKFQYPIQELFTGPDTNFIYANQWDLWRFVKIDANSGDIIDSVYLGSIFGVSKDNKCIYVRGNYIGTIKKLDFNTYEIVDSIDNYQDIVGRIKDVKLTNDGRLIVSLIDDNYAFAILNEEDFEITFKQLKAELGEYFNYPTQIATSPKNDYFILDQYYKKFNQQTNQWEPWDEVHVWDLQTLRPVGKTLYYGPMSKFSIFTFSPDGEYVFIRDSVLHIYETGNFNLIKTMDATRCIDFTEDGKTFLINFDPVMQYWNLFDFNQICIQPTHSTLTMKLSLDNKNLYKYNVAIHNLIKAESCLLTDINEDLFVSTGKTKIHQELNSLLIEDLETDTLLFPLLYTINDIKGNIIQQGEADYDGAHIRIDISNLINGVYFVEIGATMSKFVKW